MKKTLIRKRKHHKRTKKQKNIRGGGDFSKLSSSVPKSNRYLYGSRAPKYHGITGSYTGSLSKNLSQHLMFKKAQEEEKRRNTEKLLESYGKGTLNFSRLRRWAIRGSNQSSSQSNKYKFTEL